MIQGLDAAIQRGPGVVNLSLGSQARNPVLDAMVAVTVGSGTLVVAAAGNSRQRGSPLEYPASLPHVLTVGALDQGKRAGDLLERLAAPRPGRARREHPRRGTRDLRAAAQLLLPSSAARASPRRSSREPRPGSGRCGRRSTSAQLFEVMRASAQDVSSPGYDAFSGFGRLDIPGALTVAPPATRPAGAERRRHATSSPRASCAGPRAPLTAAGRKSGAVNARLDFGEDPRDVYRVWIPGRRAASIALQPSGGDVDLAAWGPRTKSVLESGTARKRDFRGLSERTGTKRERLRVKNPAKKGAYFYVEASVGAGTGNVVRKVAGLRYTLSVSTVKLARR